MLGSSKSTVKLVYLLLRKAYWRNDSLEVLDIASIIFLFSRTILIAVASEHIIVRTWHEHTFVQKQQKAPQYLQQCFSVSVTSIFVVPSFCHWSLNKKEWGKVALLHIWEVRYCEITLFIQKHIFWFFEIKHLNYAVLHKPFLLNFHHFPVLLVIGMFSSWPLYRSANLQCVLWKLGFSLDWFSLWPYCHSLQSEESLHS